VPLQPTVDMEKAYRRGWFRPFRARYHERVKAAWPEADPPTRICSARPCTPWVSDRSARSYLPVWRGAGFAVRRRTSHHRRPARSAPALCRWRWVRWIMQNTVEALVLRSGYARFALCTGRKFVVGEDFRRPGPIGRILPRLKIASDRCDTLFDSIRQRSQPKRSDATHRRFQKCGGSSRAGESRSRFFSILAGVRTSRIFFRAMLHRRSVCAG
jgi:hypothetical protein